MENEELVKYLDDLLETSENEDERKKLEEIKEKLEAVKVDKTLAELLEDMTEDEKTKYLQEIKEEVRKEMEKDKIQAYADEHKISFDEAEKKLKELAEKDEKKFQEESKRLEEKVKQLEEDAKKKESDIEAKIQALEEKLEKDQEEKKSLEEKVKNLTERETGLHRKLHEAEVKAKIKELTDKGIYPAVLEIAEAIMLADGDTVKCFEEDPDNKDQKKSVDKSLEEAVIMMMEAIPKDARIDTSEKAKAETEKRTKKPMAYEEVKAEVKKYADEHNISEEDAQVIIMTKLEEEGRYPLEESTEE